jgi:hypothetical protein
MLHELNFLIAVALHIWCEELSAFAFTLSPSTALLSFITHSLLISDKKIPNANLKTEVEQEELLQLEQAQ